MRLKVNRICNVLTGNLSNAYRRADGTVAPEITVPYLRLRLTVDEAEEMAKCLAEAVAVAREQEGK